MRWPWTIWLYTLAELWRLLLLSTAVLVLVVSFAATAKPLMDGKIGGLTALKFMLYAVPPMLQYALPFSACFAAVLTYHRLASDNELTAARAGGVSTRALLAPAAATGLALALLMGVLGESVIPRFLRAMQVTVTQDVASLIQGSIAGGRPLELGGWIVHADEARALGPDAESGAYERLMLTRPVAVQLDEQGRVEGATTASVAWAWLKRTSDEGRGATTVDIYLEQASGSQEERARGSGGLWLRQRVADSMRDSPKYMTYRELRALPATPERLNVVDRARRELALKLARQRLGESLDAALRARGVVTLGDSEGRTYEITGGGLAPLPAGEAGVQAWTLVPPARGKVEVRVRGAGGALARLAEADGATLRHDGEMEAARGQLSLVLDLSGVRVRSSEQSAATARPELSYAGLSPAENPLPALLRLGSADLLAAAPDEGATAAPVAELRKRVTRVTREVAAKVHERAAVAATCLVIVVVGALTAIRLQDRLPLVVYAWCFFPALVAVLTVNVGQSMAIDVGPAALPAVWAGLAALLAYGVWTYRRVARH